MIVVHDSGSLMGHSSLCFWSGHDYLVRIHFDNMPIPDVVKCPICDEFMTPHESGSSAGILESHKLGGSEKKYYRTKIFKCPKCNNLQSFLNTDEF